MVYGKVELFVTELANKMPISEIEKEHCKNGTIYEIKDGKITRVIFPD